MEKLTEVMKDMMTNNGLGFVATVNDDGTPNLSPKGTFLILDDEHLIFGEIRSPNTLKNLKERPAMEVNFIDFLVRKGFRVKGNAQFLERGTLGFDELIPRFAKWGDLTTKINGIVKLKIDQAQMLTSPAYDTGATEDELRESWRAHFLEG